MVTWTIIVPGLAIAVRIILVIFQENTSRRLYERLLGAGHSSLPGSFLPFRHYWGSRKNLSANLV